MEDKTIVAIEIGSSKVRGAIGNYSPAGVLTVQAVEEEPMLDCVRYGVVSNIEELAMLINRILRKIENRVSPRKVTSVYVGMGGRSFCSLPREVESQFAEDVEITDEILDSLIREASVSPYADRELFQVVPREYVVDKKAVNRPKGTVGRNIRMSANLIVCRPQIKRNIDRLFNEKLKLNINGYCVRQLALGDVVLTFEEKRLGCMLVDFGAETTTVSIYKNGRLQYMATLPLGSRNITRDIMKINCLEEKAEALKCKIGNAAGSNVSVNGFMKTVDNIDFTEVNSYVSHRAGEIIANIHKQLEYAGFKSSDMTGGVVIVGGGSRLAGFNEALEKKLAMRMRVGSVNITEVRLPDSRISPTDAADVISVLYRAAVDGCENCLTVPEMPRETVSENVSSEVKPSIKAETLDEPEKPSRKPEKQQVKERFSWLDKLKDKIATVMTEPDDDFDDTQMKR